MRVILTKILIAVILIIPMCAGIAVCKDRSGLVTGCGISAVPLVHTNQLRDSKHSFTNRGLKIGINLCMGYAINHRHVLVMMADAVFPEDPEGLGYIGPMYFHYFPWHGKRVYLASGLGALVSAWGGNWLGGFGVGPGAAGGLGCEILPRMHCDLIASIGTTHYGVNRSHVRISLNLRFLSY